MSTTITAEATAAELLTELRDLVDRYDAAETLEDIRRLADDVTRALRTVRGRIRRLTPRPEKTDELVKPTPVAAEPAAGKKPPESAPAAAPPPAVPHAVRPAPRRTPFHVALAVLTVVSSLWWTSSTRTRHGAWRAVRAVRSTGRCAGRLAAAVRHGLARIGGAS